MFKKVLVIGLCAAAMSLSAAAQLTRETQGGTQGNGLMKNRNEVPLPARMKPSKAPAAPSSVSRYFHTVVPAQVEPTVKVPMKAPARAVSISGKLEGALCYSSGIINDTKGWYTGITATNYKLAWSLDSYYRYSGPHAAFVKGDKVYALSYTNTTTGIQDAGYMTFDLATGNKIEEGSFDIFQGYDVCAYFAAYDYDKDIVWAITYNKSGNAAAMQTYDTDTHTFTYVADVSYSMIPLTFAYCPVDGCLYGIDDTADLVKWDYTSNKFVKVGSTGFPTDEYLGAMVYSPADNGFLAILDDYDTESTELILFPIDGSSHTVIGARANSETWATLYVSDQYAPAGAPMAIESDDMTIDFPDGSLTGSVSATLPTKDVDGNDLTDRVYLVLTVDDDEVGRRSGNPGDLIAIDATLTEGEHKIKLTPFVYSGLNELRGASTVVTRYIGIDTPAAPSEVTIAPTKVTWTAVTEGVHKGYIDVAAIKYNVYVDGVKMNSAPVSGTSLDVTMPAGSVSHKAAVEAVGSDGKVSARTESESIVTSTTLELPVYIAPEEGQQDLDEAVIDMFEIIDVNGDGKTWNYDRQNPYTGGFYQLCASDETAPSDDWLMLPGINFPDAAGFYKLEMEVGCPDHYFQQGPEVLEVAVGPSADPSAMTVITPATEYVKEKGKEMNWVKYEQIFQVTSAGVNYIGLHCITPQSYYRIYARHFRVTAINTSASAPAAVTGLTAIRGENGALNATVKFNLPSVDREGKTLTASSVKAVVKCGEISNEVSGTPGSEQTTVIATKQGLNDISVTTWDGNVEGETVHVEVYTGEDSPQSVALDYAISADNRTLTLSWTLPATGPNGYNVDPAKCSYDIYRYLSASSAWVKYDTVEGEMSWTYQVGENEAQKVEQFGVFARNAIGGSGDTYPIMSAVLGKPYTLPMVEAFPTNSQDEVLLSYEPMFIQGLTELSPWWGFADPAEVDPTAANASSTALYAQYQGVGQLDLPKFSTVGCSNVKVGLSIFFGGISVKQVEVFATCDDIMMQPLASYGPADGSGWEMKEISLPAAFNGKQWVAISIRVTNEDFNCIFLMDRYEIRNLDGVDFKVAEFTGDFRLNMGDHGEYFASVENNGAEPAAAPGVTLGIYRGSQLLRNVEMIGDPDNSTINPGERMDYAFALDADRELLGKGVMRFKIEGTDVDMDNNESAVAFHVLNGNIPVVDDLEAVAVDGNVNLSWGEARILEDAEVTIPFTYGPAMGAFKNIDVDGERVYGLSNIAYVGKYQPKAYQAIPVSEIGNPLITSHSGDIMLMAMSPSSGNAAEDYLISPAVEGGSKVTFYATSITDQFGEETLKVMVSTTDDEPESFTEVETFTLPSPAWTRFDVQLPADARYFAIVYVSADRFGLLLDDIYYTPAAPKAVVNGYNVYRTNVAVAQGVSGLTYTDANVNDGRYMYNVAVSALLNGAAEEGNMSNPVYVTMESVGIGNVDESAKASIYALEGAVGLTGFEGHTVMIYTVDGRLVASAKVTDAKAVVPVAPGTYMVRCATSTAKLHIR